MQSRIVDIVADASRKRCDILFQGIARFLKNRGPDCEFCGAGGREMARALLHAQLWRQQSLRPIRAPTSRCVVLTEICVSCGKVRWRTCAVPARRPGKINGGGGMCV